MEPAGFIVLMQARSPFALELHGTLEVSHPITNTGSNKVIFKTRYSL